MLKELFWLLSHMTGAEHHGGGWQVGFRSVFIVDRKEKEHRGRGQGKMLPNESLQVGPHPISHYLPPKQHIMTASRDWSTGWYGALVTWLFLVTDRLRDGLHRSAALLIQPSWQSRLTLTLVMALSRLAYHIHCSEKWGKHLSMYLMRQSKYLMGCLWCIVTN